MRMKPIWVTNWCLLRPLHAHRPRLGDRGPVIRSCLGQTVESSCSLGFSQAATLRGEADQGHCHRKLLMFSSHLYRPRLGLTWNSASRSTRVWLEFGQGETLCQSYTKIHSQLFTLPRHPLVRKSGRGHSSHCYMPAPPPPTAQALQEQGLGGVPYWTTSVNLSIFHIHCHPWVDQVVDEVLLRCRQQRGFCCLQRILKHLLIIAISNNVSDKSIPPAWNLSLI